MFNVGDAVSWKAAGKIARLEGKAGQIVSGEITEVHLETNDLSVMPNHRLPDDAAFNGMGARVSMAKII